VRGKNIPLIRIILESGCDINMTGFDTDGHKTSWKRTVLQCAIEMNDLELVSYLMNHGANASLRCFDVMLDDAMFTYHTGSLL
jgi:hypothetical protein